jgi:DNA polymerase-3 subunit gamma/tau
MRDLMVIKSTGAESELLILTAEQRKRAGELAEKFDVAALIYNITTLERLRWALKNSDTPRALLEASLLRFALSEHFLNVDDLLRRLQTGSGAVKKKEPMSAANRVSRETQGDKGTKAQSHKGTEAQSDKGTEEQRHRGTEAQSERGTEEQRHRGTEAQSDKGTEEQRHKGTEAQNNEQQTTSDEQRGKFETAADGQKRAEPAPPQPETDIRHPPKAETPDRRTSGRKRNEMISDPAVKTILMGLDATITGIEENQQN